MVKLPDIVTINSHFSLLDGYHSHQAVQKNGLAGPRVTDNGSYLAGTDVDAKVHKSDSSSTSQSSDVSIQIPDFNSNFVFV